MEDPPNQEDTGGATTPTPTVDFSEDTVVTASNPQNPELFNNHPSQGDLLLGIYILQKKTV